MRADFSESLSPRCCRSNSPMDWGRYNALYLTSMFNFDIIPFQMPATNDPPLSDVTNEGNPKKDAQEVRKAVAASDDEASRRGMAWRKRLVLQMAVSKYL